MLSNQQQGRHSSEVLQTECLTCVEKRSESFGLLLLLMLLLLL